MQPIDWLLVALPLGAILALAIYTRRYVKSVADFLAGGRCAGRYLIANAFGESASGVANYRVFPAISSRFFVYFIGLPLRVSVLGASVPTFAIIMAGYLICVLVMLTIGGQITLMVTDCAEGILSHLVLLIITVAVLI